MSHVFLSYLHEDEEVVEKVAAELRRQGLEVWLDRDSIAPGQPWEAAIESAIDAGAYVIACFSEHLLERPASYLETEIKFALQCTKKGIRPEGWLLPVRLSPMEIPDIRIDENTSIRDLQWIDLFEDFFDGVRQILRVVRPRFSREGETERWLRAFCDRHIEAKIARDVQLGALRFRDIEDRWRSLTFPSVWNPSFEVLMSLAEKTEYDATPLTERLDEPSKAGRSIIVTVAKTADKAVLKQALPGVGLNGSNAYGEYLRQERRRFRETNLDWPFRDMIHWIWTFTNDAIEVDLLYWINFKLEMTCWGYRMELAKSRNEPVGPIQSMYPGSLITSPQMEEVVNEVVRQEAVLCRDMAANNE